jgi:hypothetical protein
MADTAVLDIPASAEAISGVTAGDHMSDMQFLDSELARIHPADETVAAEPAVEEPSTDEVLDEAIAETSQPAIDPATGKPITAVTDVATEVKPDVKPAVDAAVADEETGDETSLTVAGLQKRLAASPHFKAAIEADPELKRQLFYTARRADRAAKYDDLFQTPTAAADMKVAADEHFERSNLYESDPEKFLQKLVFDSFVRDDQGRVKLENGVPVQNGAYTKLMATQRGFLYDQVTSHAQHMITNNLVGENFNGQDVLEALRIFKAIVDGSPAKPGETKTSSGEENLPDHIKAELAESRRLRAERASTDAQTSTQFGTTVEQKMSDGIRSDAKAMLAKRLPANSALSDYLREKVIDDTVKEIERLAKGNAAHMNYISRSLKTVARNDEGASKIVTARQSFAKELMPRVLARFLHQATNAVVASTDATRKKINSQSRPEVVTSGGVKSPSRPDVKRAGEAVVAKNKHASDMDVINAVLAAQGRS